MAWKSKSFKVYATGTSKVMLNSTVSPKLRLAMDELSARAGTYADVRRKRVESIKDDKLRESVAK